MATSQRTQSTLMGDSSASIGSTDDSLEAIPWKELANDATRGRVIRARQGQVHLPLMWLNRIAPNPHQLSSTAALAALLLNPYG